MATSGILFPIAAVAAGAASRLIISSSYEDGMLENFNNSWTPPQYAKGATTVVTIPAQSSGSSGQQQSPELNFVFDAVLRLGHRRTLTKTQHPVLTGASISDHAYLQPSRLVMDIGMSDAMAPFEDGVWVGSSTKSVSAWQILKQLQLNKTLLTITTRLDVYYNMLIEELDSPDDNKSYHGLRVNIVFGEILSASVASLRSVGSRPQTTSQSVGGTVQAVAPNNSQLSQNVIPSSLWPNTATYPNVPGAGLVSSNSLGQVLQVLS